MPTHRNSVFSLETAALDYFAQLNPIANKIANDIQETKLAYGQLWHSLKANEHNDIINETLMKPEISLHYFDKFSSSSSISKLSSASSKCNSSYRGSTDSLVAVVTKHNNDDTSVSNNLIKKEKILKTKYSKTNASGCRHYYGFDRRNLNTFALQKVSLKIVHDDISGSYRDEHSTPFSYKTKSQINLHIFSDNEFKNDQVCLLGTAECERLMPNNENTAYKLQTISNYPKLQNERSNHIDMTPTNKDELITESMHGRSAYTRFFNSTCKAADNAKAELLNSSTTQINGNVLQSMESSNIIKQKELLKSYIDSGATSANHCTYAIYSDVYFDHGENTNLMHNCGSTVLTASSSSVATSDDEIDDDDEEKTLCEGVKLLDNDITLRKGFDFLNNW